jgi:hypothetical protein
MRIRGLLCSQIPAKIQDAGRHGRHGFRRCRAAGSGEDHCHELAHVFEAGRAYRDFDQGTSERSEVEELDV